ncbi:MAG: glutamine-hydrolyzing GMP synthase [Nitrososphaerales archaeon]
MQYKEEKVIVLDFGAQYAHLIARRVRHLSVYSELLPYDTSPSEISKINPSGIIFSGGPSSVHEKGSPRPQLEIFELGIPILGICYGLQVMVDILGGEVIKAPKREYGKASLEIDEESDLLSGIGPKTTVWMSHGDAPTKPPNGFITIGHTENSPYAAIRDESAQLFGLQFHPEVSHTPEGSKILQNFLFKVCKCKGSWMMESFVDSSVDSIKQLVGEGEKVLCALSGGIDSTVTAVLLQRAIPSNLTCVFVDHGLLRLNEANNVKSILEGKLGLNVMFEDEGARFISKLNGVFDPEEKRKIIGEEFIRSFEQFSDQHGPFEWLAQGTLYPDVIESAGGTGPSSRIKAHHNVGGLPEKMAFKLIEPLKDLYKDEVKTVGALLGLPKSFLEKHPFPGPGLAVRIIGEVTTEKLRICRDASAIVEEEITSSALYAKVWQAFAIVGDDRATGIQGDQRSEGYMVTIRVVESVDAMTADWTRLPFDLLEKMSNRITNEISKVSWVSYAISSKPPSTIEPQ